MDTVADPSDTGGTLIAASKVNGTSVYDTAGEKLGSVYDVVLQKVSGQVEYAILSFGGFLGIGEKFHPLPWKQLRYDTSRGGYVVNLDRAQLEGAPTYAADEIGSWDSDRKSRIDDYYGSADPMLAGVAGVGGIGTVAAAGGALGDPLADPAGAPPRPGGLAP